MEYFLIAIFIGLIPASIAKKKGRSFILWWFYGAVLFIVALPMAIMMKPYEGGTISAGNLRKCPKCAELIQPEASVCKHCRAEIEPLSSQEIENRTKQLKKSKYVPGWLVAVAILGSIMLFIYMGSKDNMSSPSSTPSKRSAADVSSAIAEKKIFIGMTADQVRASWGKPYKINSSMGAGWEHEQWVVHGIFQGGQLLVGMGAGWEQEQDRLNSSYLYFENGILTSIQQSE
jgi:hypothetical protein